MQVQDSNQFINGMDFTPVKTDVSAGGTPSREIPKLQF